MDAGAGQDVDVVLTTREIDRMIRAEHIMPEYLEEEEFDTPLGISSGAAVIFGAQVELWKQPFELPII